MILLTDGSVDPQSRVGFGGYLCFQSTNSSVDALKNEVILKRFTNTSSTQLELETILWALREMKLPIDESLQLYTDSQNILSLLARRSRLEERGFCNKAGEPLQHHLLYREFFQTIDSRSLNIQKIKGHRRKQDKTNLDKIFTCLDRSTRQALRAFKDRKI